ncbi:hypothetical protein [Actinomadura gamaensis]|uniref:Transposase n=1 Tax=Actinomadura gamaensis TaxID=1763541 RepID=A0ABV9U4P9_9ACTN
MGNGIVEDNKMARWLARLVEARQTRPAPARAPASVVKATDSPARPRSAGA